jgi:hypothetical protein
VEEQWFIRLQGMIQGPFTVPELHFRAKRKKFTRVYEVSQDGATWSGASKHPELFPAVSASPKLFRQASADAADEAPISGQGASVIELPETEVPGVLEDLLSAQPVDPGLDGEPEFKAVDGATEGWYFSRGSEQCGPVSASELQTRLALEQLGPDDYVWKNGMPEWVQVRRMFPRSPRHSSPSIPAAARDQERAKLSPTAIMSFVLGVAGMNILLFIGSIGAVVLGHVALSQIKSAPPGRLEGRGLAIAGLILGYAVLGLGALAGIVFLSISSVGR